MRYCTNCGVELTTEAPFCPSCNTRVRKFAAPQPVPNYLIPSIVVTLFCCFPLGIVAIIFSASVNTKAMAGDVAGAQQASRRAKMWCWIAFGVGLALAILYGAFVAYTVAQNN